MPRFPDRFPAETVGPLGFPMTDRSARDLEARLRALPAGNDHAYRHRLLQQAPSELNPGERSDVSWITTQSVDRTGEVVLARGMDDAQFRQNPLVTLGHHYDLPPVGRSLWRRRVVDGRRVGIKAKTQYPAAPASWPAGTPWVPDQVFALVEAGLLQGKSIGFLPLKVHVPEKEEVGHNGWDDGVRLVIDEWLLLEYACVTLPANQDALVEAVSKGAVRLPAEARRALDLPDPAPAPPAVVPFTALAEVERAVERQVAAIDLGALVRRCLEDAVGRARGRV